MNYAKLKNTWKKTPCEHYDFLPKCTDIDFLKDTMTNCLNKKLGATNSVKNCCDKLSCSNPEDVDSRCQHEIDPTEETAHFGLGM